MIVIPPDEISHDLKQRYENNEKWLSADSYEEHIKLLRSKEEFAVMRKIRHAYGENFYIEYILIVNHILNLSHRILKEI